MSGDPCRDSHSSTAAPPAFQLPLGLTRFALSTTIPPDFDCNGFSTIGILLVHFQNDQKPSTTRLLFNYTGRDFLVAPNEPLRVLAGDSVRSFFPDGTPAIDAAVGGEMRVNELYRVTSDDLAWLASVPKARARVMGEKSECEFPLSEEALILAGLFNDRVVHITPLGVH